MKKVLVIAFAIACGGEIAIEGDPATVAPLPTVPVASASATPIVARVATQSTSDSMLSVNFAEIRKHPEGARVAMIVAATPQWRPLTTDSRGATQLDIARDFEWTTVIGSLVESANDVAITEHGTADAQMDSVLEEVARKYGGGPVDLHVAGVRAWKANVPDGERVFVRVAPHIVATVPAARADAFARELASHPIARPQFHADEELRLRVKNPGATISSIPEDISELRLWVDGHPIDATADIFMEGDCPSPQAAQADAATLQGLIQEKNSFPVRILTEGLFTGAVVTTLGDHVHVRIHATQRQIEALLTLIAGQVHATLPSRTP